MLEIAVIEDEPIIAKRLVRFIQLGLDSKEHRIKHFDNFYDAEEYLSENVIDLLFLDLNLNGKDGFDLLKVQVAASYHVIVVSANTDRALEAFELGVLDFVGKPFTQERIYKSLNRAVKKDRSMIKPTESRALGVIKRGKIEIVPLERLDYIKAAGHYSELVLLDGSEQLHSKSLSKLLDILPKNFQQVHRSYIVSLQNITEIIVHPGTKYEIRLTSGNSIPMGRTYYREVKALIASE